MQNDFRCPETRPFEGRREAGATALSRRCERVRRARSACARRGGKRRAFTGTVFLFSLFKTWFALLCRNGSPRLATAQRKSGPTVKSTRCIDVVRPAGFEPATFGLEVHCSIQLSYERVMVLVCVGIIPQLPPPRPTKPKDWAENRPSALLPRCRLV